MSTASVKNGSFLQPRSISSPNSGQSLSQAAVFGGFLHETALTRTSSTLLSGNRNELPLSHVNKNKGASVPPAVRKLGYMRLIDAYKSFASLG